MKRKAFLVTNTVGFSNRVAARLVYLVKASKSEVWIEEDGQKRDGKSIVDVLGLAMRYGTMLTVTVKGEDEEAVMRQISELIESDLGLV